MNMFNLIKSKLLPPKLTAMQQRAIVDAASPWRVVHGLSYGITITDGTESRVAAATMYWGPRPTRLGRLFYWCWKHTGQRYRVFYRYGFCKTVWE